MLLGAVGASAFACSKAAAYASSAPCSGHIGLDGAVTVRERCRSEITVHGMRGRDDRDPFGRPQPPPHTHALFVEEAEQRRRQFQFEPAGITQVSAGTRITGRSFRTPAGWIFASEHAPGTALAWLDRFDPASWRVRAITLDQAWAMEPRGRQASELVAFNSVGETVARAQRPFLLAGRLIVGTTCFRLRPPSLLRSAWDLRDSDGTIAQLDSPKKDTGPWTVNWERTPEPATLLTMLFTCYTIIVQRANQWTFGTAWTSGP
jgi:hypothetical protein